MIEKIEIFEGDKLIPFEIVSFDLSVKSEIKDDKIYFNTNISILGKPLSNKLYECNTSQTGSLKVEITETYKEMISKATIENLYISEMYSPISEDLLVEVILIQKWE